MAEESSAFTGPAVGDRFTLVPRVGKKHSGVITAITEDTVTMDGKTYAAADLVSETCRQLFAKHHAASVARERIRAERAEYLTRRAEAEQAERRLAERLAAEQQAMDEQARLAIEAQERREAAEAEAREKESRLQAQRDAARRERLA
jgi:hypothetical protein